MFEVEDRHDYLVLLYVDVLGFVIVSFVVRSIQLPCASLPCRLIKADVTSWHFIRQRGWVDTAAAWMDSVITFLHVCIRPSGDHILDITYTGDVQDERDIQDERDVQDERDIQDERDLHDERDIQDAADRLYAQDTPPGTADCYTPCSMEPHSLCAMWTCNVDSSI